MKVGFFSVVLRECEGVTAGGGAVRSGEGREGVVVQ